MSGQVVLSYSPSEQFSQLLPSLKTQLPILNLHWKSNARSLRTIQSINIDFEQFPPHSLPEPHLGVTIRPTIHTYFVACDDSEVYRSSVRKEIRDWLDLVEKRKGQEWLIVNVVPKGKEGIGRWARKSGVLDKIKADFNTTKKERCLQISQPGTDWTEFLLKLKEAIISTFDSYVSSTEDEIRKQDLQRQVPGWNFCRFFLFKESLALSFESLSLYQDALQCYDELEASFFFALRSSNLSWFDKIGGTAPDDDSAPLLSITKKPYRDYLLKNEITVFDFRCYLFARQAKLLGRLGRIEEAGRRGEVFISNFARTLRENEAALAPNFIESWIYSGCLNIVDQCLKWGLENGMEGQMQSFGSVKAELLDLAKKQLEKVGVQYGHLPNAHPFSVALNEHVPNSADTSSSADRASSLPPISQKDLIEAIASKEALDQLYVKLTNRAIEAYQASGRKRFALKLHASLAALERYRDHLPSAQRLFSPLPGHYVESRWTGIESSLLRHTCDLQEKLDMPKERLLSVLALLRAGLPPDAEQLLIEVKQGAAKLDKDFAAISFPAFDVRLKEGRGKQADGEDGVIVSLIVENKLPCSMETEEIRIKFSTTTSDQVWFASGPHCLQSGINHVDVFSASPISGRLHLQLAQIRYSRIVFQYSYKVPSKGDLRTSLSQEIFMSKDRDAFDASIEAPSTICLDQKRAVLVVLRSGRNDVRKAVVSLATNEPGIVFKYDESYIPLGGGITQVKRGIEVEGIKPSERMEVMIPFTGVPREAKMDVNLSVDYYTNVRPDQRRALKRMLPFSTSLEVAVNVQDFFRTNCLISRFTIASYNGEPFRVSSAAVQGSTDLNSQSTRSQCGLYTVLGDQTASFLFKFNHKEPTVSHMAALSRFVLHYISIKEELSAMIRVVTEKLVKERQLWKYIGLLTEITSRWLEDVDTEHYALSDELILPREDPQLACKLKHQLLIDDGVADSLVECVKNVREVSARHRLDSSEMPWRSLEIPVEMPSMTIINVVKVLAANTSGHEVGEALPVQISIHSSFEWNVDETIYQQNSVGLVYDVAADPEDWLVTGRKKGEFLVSPSNPKECVVSLTLVALRPGRLFLPSIVISPIDPTTSCETQYTNAVQHIDVRPVTSKTTFHVSLHD
ncbi:hypothetical protein BT69DRAFT_195496 [Atractiella rhizophila]|nr:hypothetical protein BT69DRAFT_195496 [Atractiella rhizophila]